MKYFATLLFVILTSTFSVFSQTDDMLDEDAENYTDKNGLKQGTWVENWDNGRVKHEVSYKNDLKEGVEMTYFKSGECVQEEAYYKAGKLDGTFTVKYEDCTVKSSTDYKNGLKNGSDIKYYSNGNKESEAIYVNDKLQGTIKMYDKDGVFVQEVTTAKQAFDMDDYVAGKSDLADTVVLSVFGRHPEWKNKLIIADVTSGMEPYAAQLLKWENMQLIKTEKRQYVFFNDGDDKEQKEKIIGKTGGIYYCDGSSPAKVKKSIKQVMTAGSGGDIEENNIEAIISALTLGKAYLQVILIADNNAGVRDLELLKRIKKPIMIVICGLGDTDEIHPDYLAIAKHTNGSIHSIHDDAKDLGKLLEGGEISIEQLKYEVKGGVFKVVK